MLINPSLSSSIKITGKNALKANPGDEVIIQVIKHLVGNKWAIGFKGKVYPAQSDMELDTGTFIRVKVVKTGSQVQFKVLKEAPGTSANFLPCPDLISTIIKKQGFPDDPLIRQIISALLKSEMALDPGIIQKIRDKLLKDKKTGITLIRLLINLLDKKIGINNINIEEILQTLDYGNNQQQGRNFTGNQKRDLSKKQIKAQLNTIMENNEGENFFQLFNHLKGKEDSWVIIPYEFITGMLLFSGNLRLLIDNNKQEAKKAVLIVNLTNGDKWSFFINPDKKNINVLVFSNKIDYIEKKSRSFKLLITNLQNIGVKIDDKIYNDKYFDGFYPIFMGNGYKPVDTII